MVTGQQIDRNPDVAHRLQRLADHSGGELVVIEDVAGHHDELGTDLGGQRPEAPHRVAAGGGISRLGVTGEEMPGHAQLPVGGVQESHGGAPSNSCHNGHREV